MSCCLYRVILEERPSVRVLASAVDDSVVKFLPFYLQLSPRCQVLLHILPVIQLLKKFSVFYGMENIISATAAASTERSIQSISTHTFLQD